MPFLFSLWTGAVPGPGVKFDGVQASVLELMEGSKSCDYVVFPSLTGYEPKTVEIKAIDTEGIEPEDLEPRRVEPERNFGTDRYQIQVFF